MGEAPDADLLRAAATALLGDRWRLGLSRLLRRPGAARTGVDYRLVRRWAKGERPVPPWALEALGAMLRERGEEIPELLRRLP